ncbi:MAG TPA: hypothetical protein VF779_19970, partial [Pyrinomonadaceae bacterium]
YTDETLSFCPNDGTPLVKDAPSTYDPQATMLGQPPPVYPQPQQPPPPQQGYYAPQGGQAPPQGGQVPPQGWQQPPYGQQQQQYPPQYGAPSVAGGKSSKLPLIIALAAIVLIGGGIGLYFLLRDNSSSSSSSRSNNNNSSTTSNTSTRTSNTNSTSTFPTPTTSTTTTNRDETSTSSTAGDYSNDEKHRLFQAVGITRDNDLIIEVAEKIGLSDSRGNPTPAMEPFAKEHFAWAKNNADWVREHLDPVKAREYVMAHK